MEDYRELRERQEREIDDFPLGFKFGSPRYEEAMEKWRLDPTKDSGLVQISSLYTGTYISKTDVPAWRELERKHREELEEAIADDTTGDGFIYQMFYTELARHEFAYTADAEPALAYLGYTSEEINSNPRLRHGLELAATRIFEEVI